MFDSPTFQSAAARRKGEIISFTIEHVAIDLDGNAGDLISHELRLDPLLDVVRLGVMFRTFSKALSAVRDAEGDDVEPMLAVLDKEMVRARGALRTAIVPHDRAKYDEVSDALDTQLLGQIIRFITDKLSGLDPTQQASSSNGSVEAGPTSTDGVQPEA